MRKAFLKNAEETLLKMREQVLADIESDAEASRSAHKDEGMDAYDLASEERDRDISMILSDRDRRKLQSVDDALARIKARTYGICEECELDIAEERLKALPFTRLCVICQGDQEREARQVRQGDDDRGVRRLAVGDGDDDGA